MYDRDKRIKLDEGTYVNKTMQYLLPTLKLWKPTLLNNMSSLLWKSFGVGDLHFSRDYIEDNFIFCLADLNNKENAFKTFTKFIREEKCYFSDYVYNKQGHQMFVLKLPKENMIINFLNGYYSKMLTDEEKKIVYKKTFVDESNIERICKVYSVVTKDKSYIYDFINELYEEFKVKLNHENLLDKELEFTPVLSNEIFNYE